MQEDIHEDHRPLALKVLRWIAVSYRSLTVEEISEACTIPPESELGKASTLQQNHRLTLDQLPNLLPNLVVLVKHDWSCSERSGSDSLSLAHFSVREYLMGPRLLEYPSANFRIQPRDAHRLVAKECLAYM
jgi:hypothetical protein